MRALWVRVTNSVSPRAHTTADVGSQQIAHTLRHLECGERYEMPAPRATNPRSLMIGGATSFCAAAAFPGVVLIAAW